jgi:5'-3' exonuclease
MSSKPMTKVLLIDLSHLFWTHWHATADQELSGAFRLTVERVHALADGYDHVGVCCDTPPYKRKTLHTDYKSNRTAAPPAAIEQFTRTKERLERDGFALFGVAGYEADDIIATFVARKPPDESIVIASNDKDLMQLVHDEGHVSILHPLKGDVVREAQVMEKWGVGPALLQQALALQGDKSDNIPGVPGIGPKTAADLLRQFGSLEDIYTGLDLLSEKKRSVLVANRANVLLAYQLIELDSTAPINCEAIYEHREPKPLTDEPTYTEEETHVDTDTDDLVDELIPPPAKSPSAPPSAPAAAAPPPQVLSPKPSTDLAVVPQGDWSLQLEPVSIGGAYKLASGLYNSRLYSRYPTAEAIWAVIIRGRELGLGALTALDCFHVVEGKPAMHAHFIIARGKKHPDCEYFQLVETTSEFAVYETKHRANPKPTKLRYTIDEARKAGFKPGSGWEKRPAEMLRKACGVQLVRIEYPDAAMGLYSIEELTGEEAA